MIAIDVSDSSVAAYDRALRGAALVVRNMLIRPTDVRLAVVCYDQDVRGPKNKNKNKTSHFLGEGGGIPTRTSQPVQCRPAPPCMHAWYPILCCLLIGDSDPILRPICVFRLTWARGAWPPSTAGPPPPRYGSFDMSWGHFSRISHAFLTHFSRISQH